MRHFGDRRGLQWIAGLERACFIFLSDGLELQPRGTLVALEPVRIKVVRKSDGVELFQGSLQSGERRDYPNVPIFLTADNLAAVDLEYKGHRYPTGHSGHERIQFDFSGR